MGVGSGGRGQGETTSSPWIFILVHGSSNVFLKEEGDLLVLFLGLGFSIAYPPPWKNFCRRPW